MSKRGSAPTVSDSECGSRQIAYRYGERTYEILRTARALVHFKTYLHLGHSTSYSMLADVLSFFEDVLGTEPVLPSNPNPV